jgi:hypothetical protein
MQSNFQEIVEALLPFLQALDRFGIPYYVGGSVASSYYGSWRRTQDVNVILAIRPDQIHALAKLLAQDYDIDADAWIDSFRHGQAFNIFYQQSFTKIDVMPLQTTHRQEEGRRAQRRSLFAGTPPIRLSSAEDTILAKLNMKRPYFFSAVVATLIIRSQIKRSLSTLDIMLSNERPQNSCIST